MVPEAVIQPRKRIALVAHDNKKRDLLQWAAFNRDLLTRHQLVATGTTGMLLEKELDVPITKLQSGPLGGDQQIGAMVASGAMDCIIFLRDPLTAQPHEPDVSALLRLCDVHSIPLATNVKSAEIMLQVLEKGIF